MLLQIYGQIITVTEKNIEIYVIILNKLYAYNDF